MAKPSRKQRREGKIGQGPKPRVELASREAPSERKRPPPSRADDDAVLADPPVAIQKTPDLRWVFGLLVVGVGLYLLVTYLTRPDEPPKTAPRPQAPPTAPLDRGAPPAMEIPIDLGDPVDPKPAGPSPSAPVSAPPVEPSAPPPPPSAPAPPPSAAPKAPPTATAKAPPSPPAPPKATAAATPPKPASVDPYE